MKNAMLTGIVAGVMGFATVATARDTEGILQTVDSDVNVVVAEPTRGELTVDTIVIDYTADDVVYIDELTFFLSEAEKVAEEIAEAQDELAERKVEREGYARRFRELVYRQRKLNDGRSDPVLRSARNFMSELDREIKELETTISVKQQYLASLQELIEQMTSSSDPQ